MNNEEVTAAIQPLTSGSRALSHLEPYVPRYARNFELPIHVGHFIAGLDHAIFVRAEAAQHMRAQDYVAGVLHKGAARAYPLWIADNYHVINDHMEGDPIVFVTCERCQSGSAFVAQLNDVRVKFNACGMYNATLAMVDRGTLRGPEHSIWIHYEGIGISGKDLGVFLPYIPVFHTTWEAWRQMHPDTEVMLPPVDRHHRDARHGHGREEYFSRPGMDRPFVGTIGGALDDTYPEHEMVLGLNYDQGVRAYPLREVKKAGGVVEDMLGGHPIVIMAGPRQEQATMAAYSRLVGERVLSFSLQQGEFVDRETESRWTIEGCSVGGSLCGTTLDPLRWCYVRWHAWIYAHRGTVCYRYTGPEPVYPAVSDTLDVSAFTPVLDALSKLGRPVTVEHALVDLRLPHQATAGIRLKVGTDPLNLYCFENPTIAEDYVSLEGAWACLPIGARWERKVSHRAGCFVLESDPAVQYADASQIVRLPDPQIQWSDLVTKPELVDAWSTGVEYPDGAQATVSFRALLQHLRQSGYDIVEVAFLPHSQLRVGTLNAIAATINADRFAIYLCEDTESACRVVSELSHSFQVGCLVFRSIPVDMYREPFYEVGQYPDAEIHWSKLLKTGDRLHVYLVAAAEAVQNAVL